MASYPKLVSTTTPDTTGSFMVLVSVMVVVVNIVLGEVSGFESTVLDPFSGEDHPKEASSPLQELPDFGTQVVLVVFG